MNIPRNVQIAVYIYFAMLAISLFGGVINYFSSEDKPSFILTLLFMGVYFGLLVKLGLLIREGRNWARDVNAGITIVSFAIVIMWGTSPTMEGGLNSVLLYINNIASIAVLVLLYTGSANEWYREKSLTSLSTKGAEERAGPPQA